MVFKADIELSIVLGNIVFLVVPAGFPVDEVFMEINPSSGCEIRIEYGRYMR